MNKLTLNRSQVQFLEEQHQYMLNGQELSGITSIIKRYIFPDMYAGIRQSVLDKAAERGTRIHNLIQLWVMGIISDDDIKELQPFLDAFAQAGLNTLESEYLVSDNQHVASAIDLVCIDQDFNIILCDIKTTSVLHVDYIRWQLSIYAYLFELQNPQHKASQLKAIHIRDGKCNIVDIERLPDDYVKSLLDTYALGLPLFDNPLNAVPEEIEQLLKAYADNDEFLTYINKVKEQYDNRKKELQERIADKLKEQKLSTIETPIAKVTIGKDSTKQSFDLKKFMESEQYQQSPDAYKAFIKDSTTKGRITITLR